MEEKERGAQVPPVGHNNGQGKTDGDSVAGLNVLRDLRASVKDSEESARLGLGRWHLHIDGIRPEIVAFINEAAQGFDCHRDKALVAALQSVAAVSGKKAICYFDNYMNHATMWSVMVDKPSGVKTSINNFFMDAVDDLDKEVRYSYNKVCDEIDEYNANNTDKKKYPKLPSLYLTNDPTPDRLNQMLEASDTGITYYRDEVVAIFNNFGRYKGVKSSDSSDWQNFIEYFNNRLPKSDRKLDVRLPVSTDIGFSLLGTIQEDVFAKKFKAIALNRDGGFDRFLFLSCPYRKKTLLSEKPRKKLDKKKWASVIKDIDKNLKCNTVYKLSDDAQNAYIKYMDEEVIMPEWADPERKQFLTGYRQKNAHYVIRLSMIIHILNDYRAEEITLKEVEMAIGMMRVFNHYADELYNKIVEEDQAKSAVKRSTADVANPKKADLVRMFFMMKQSEGVASSDVNQSEVARMFGMSQPQVSAIRKKMIADGMLTDGGSDETEDSQEDVNEQEVTDITVTSSAQDVADDSQEDVNISSSTDESQLNTTDSPTPSKPPKIDNSTDKIGVSPDKRKKDNPSS